MVTVEPLSPWPVCPNQVLVYDCQLEFQSLSIRWEHSEFGTLGFIASRDAVGATRMTSDGRVIANLTVNEGLMPHRMVASTLRIQPPLNNLNGTNLNGTDLICQGFELENGAKNGVATIVFRGE